MKRNGEGAAEWLNISLQLQWFRAAIKQLTWMQIYISLSANASQHCSSFEYFSVVLMRPENLC
jgi:hypothetical protein